MVVEILGLQIYREIFFNSRIRSLSKDLTKNYKLLRLVDIN